MARSLGCGGMARSADPVQFKALKTVCEKARSLGCGGIAGGMKPGTMKI